MIARIPRTLTVTLVTGFLLAPVVVVTVASLNAKQFLDFPIEQVSFRWYEALLTDSQWRSAVSSSLTIAAASAALAVAIALPMAYVLHTYRPRLLKLFFALGVLPFMLPPVISAMGALVLWNELGRIGRIENVVIAHGVFFSSIPLITVGLALRDIDPSLDEAAMTLGASGRRRFLTIVLPLLVPSIVTGYVAAFVLSLNEYIIAFMVAGFTVETLPIKIFNSLRYGFTPTIAAVSVVFTGVSVLALSVLARIGGLERLLGGSVSR